MFPPQQRHRKVAILTLQGVQKLQAAIAQLDCWNHYAKSVTLEALSEQTGLSTHTLSKVHARQASVDLRTLIRYFSAFNLTLESEDYCQPPSTHSAQLSRSIQTQNQTSDSNPLFHHASSPPMTELTDLQTRVSWGVAPNVSRFYGRTTELATLQQWILEERCRLVTLLGMGGIGKTWLATKLAEQIQHQFKVVIWRSLQPISRSHSPLPFSHFLDDLIRQLSPHPTPTIPELVAAKIHQLIDLLRRTPCLLVLDNIESVLSSGTSISNSSTSDDRSPEPDNSDDEAYSKLLKHLGQGRHQSCVILTSRAELQPFWLMFANPLETRSLRIQGLSIAEIQQMFQDQGTFQGSAVEWHRLVNYYSGNPLILYTVARIIQRLFDGSITEFLQHNALIFDDLCEWLNQQLGELSYSEQSVMNVLAVQSTPIAFSDLRSHLSSALPTAVLLEVLKSLEARSLIERQEARLFLQPLLRDYVKEQFVLSSNRLVNGRAK